MLSNELRNFTGTETWTRHALGALLFTDGIKFLRDKEANGVVDCFWLVDAIASHQSDRLDKQCDGFQVWTLISNGKGGAILTCKADTGRPDVVRQEIEYSDFPFDQFPDEPLQLWVEGIGRPPKTGEVAGRVLLVPSEH
jgi:hypothetical protein